MVRDFSVAGSRASAAFPLSLSLYPICLAGGEGVLQLDARVACVWRCARGAARQACTGCMCGGGWGGRGNWVRVRVRVLTLLRHGERPDRTAAAAAGLAVGRTVIVSDGRCGVVRRGLTADGGG